MRESRKKVRAGASPSSPSAASSGVESAVLTEHGLSPSEHIRLRAYELYRERGGKVGDDMGDWLQAEREYLDVSTTAQVAGRDGQRASDLTTPASQS